MPKLEHYRPNQEYCEYLRIFDSKVPKVTGDKEDRKFVGIVLDFGESIQYFVPLTSPKPKHQKMKNQVDFLKMDSGKLGAINFNNMIPVYKGCFGKVDIKAEMNENSDSEDLKYLNLLIDQAKWMSKNKNIILKKSLELYELVVNGEQHDKLRQRVVQRCCDFTLLEERSLNYQVKEFESIFTDLIDLEKLSKSEFQRVVNTKSIGLFYTVNRGFIVGYDNRTDDRDYQRFESINELKQWLQAKNVVEESEFASTSK